MANTLITNIALYDGEKFFPKGCVLITDGRIAYAGEDGGYSVTGARVIDGKGGICMPGLVNAHTHAPMTLLRGIGADLPLREWLERLWPIEDRLDDDAVYWGSMLAIAEMLRRGITCYADMYMFVEECVHAAKDAGIRANLSRPVTADDGERLREAVSTYRQWDGAGDGRIKIFLALHAEYTSGPEHVAPLRDAALELGTGVHVHISETDREVGECYERRGVSPVRYFEQLGLYDCHTLAAHCVSIDEEDIRILAERGVWVAHNPISNLKLASGVAPVREMLGAGVRLALGTDSVASNNQYDLFAEMRMAAILQKGIHKDSTLMPVQSVLAMGTRMGARALGFEDVGTLTPGARADLILLDPNAENLSSTIDSLADLVYSAQGLNVRLTMVDGKVLYQDGVFTTIDAERMMAMFRKAQKRLLG